MNTLIQLWFFFFLKIFTYYQNDYQQLIPKKVFACMWQKRPSKWVGVTGGEKKGHLRVVQVWQSLLVPYELGN